MIFEVDNTIINDEKQYQLLLEVTVSVWGSEAGRHRWYVEDVEAFCSSKWFEEYIPKPQKENLRKTITRSAHDKHPKRSRNFFTIGGQSTSNIPNLGLEDAKKVLQSPLIVVTENAESDATFVKALIRCFGNKVINESIGKFWLRFDHAGGIGEIEKAAKRQEGQLTLKGAIMRTYILFDSDKEHEKDDWRGKGQSKGIRNLEASGYTVHGLYKRMIENYLPDVALETIVNEKGKETDKLRVDVIKGLSEVQRDFYNFKNGFNGKGNVPQNQSSLFIDDLANPKSDKFKALRDGFGKSFPLVDGFALTHIVTAQSLRARCNHHPNDLKDELENIVKRLTEML